MREIKFRAWQPHDSLNRAPGIYQVNDIVWYDEPTINKTEDTEDTEQTVTGEVFFKEHTSSEYLEDVVLMQYTGLKDINNKDIYEGDIISDGLFTFVVEYGLTGFVVNNMDNDDLYTFADEPYKVIGNIYENPELLK